MFDSTKDILDLTYKMPIDESRQEILNSISEYMNQQIKVGQIPQLNFICTHNSRRSQLAQIWAKVAANHYGIELQSYSGGTEVTALNPRVITSLERFNFSVKNTKEENPRYNISFDGNLILNNCFSKLYDASINPTSNFAAVMTCSSADDNCPFVPGCDVRIPLTYDDPKSFDDTPLEDTMYDYRSFQIATEMFYAFSKVRQT